jgi:hypothetical protein
MMVHGKKEFLKEMERLHGEMEVCTKEIGKKGK